MKTYRIAAIGFAHSHMRANLEAFASCGERVEFVAAADVPPRIPSLSVEPDTRRCELDRAVEQYGFRKYEDYRQLLEENEIDIALAVSYTHLDVYKRQSQCRFPEQPACIGSGNLLSPHWRPGPEFRCG